MMFLTQYKKTKQQLTRGFTLVEMIVVAAIFTVITSVVMFKYGDFTSNMLVTNMAYEIALEIRQAQVFGLGARGSDDGAGNAVFTRPYGVFINLLDGSTGSDEEGALETKKIQFFIDRNTDEEEGYGQCNATGGAGVCSCANDECISQVTLQRNIKITEVRTNAVGSGDTCESSNVEYMAITFKRPSPEARIERQGQELNPDDYEFVQIKVEAPGSSVNPSYVLVRKSGQISVSENDICAINNQGA
jgi:prepilin-type N-terminal cleavage/methylation domain-containing protein